MPNGHKYTNIFHSKTLPNLPKLDFLFENISSVNSGQFPDCPISLGFFQCTRSSDTVQRSFGYEQVATGVLGINVIISPPYH
jgi:hypothetical protein